jgi:hypothetical protein
MIGQMNPHRPGCLPQEPTSALPGTEQKILVMMERAARREQLFHPLDGLAVKVDASSPPAELPSLAAVAACELAGVAVTPDDGEDFLFEDDDLVYDEAAFAMERAS